MPSSREAYFSAIKDNIPKTVVDFVLQEINGLDAFSLAKHFDDEIKDFALFESSINRYKNGEMIEYIFNKAYFLSDAFYVDKNVLIPRQETEDLVLKTIAYIKEMFPNEIISIADVCTGSGCIGVSIAKRMHGHHYFLTDISNEALKVAKINVNNLLTNGDDITLLNGDMLSPLIGKIVDVIICNPPYISDVSSIDEKTWKQEPHLALLANPNTLFYERILKDFHEVTSGKYLLAFEIGEDMEEALSELVNKYCQDCEFSFEKDMYDKTRFLFIKHQ